VSDETLIAWTAEPLNDPEQQDHFLAAITYADELRRIGKAYRTLGFWVGGVSSLIALVSVLTIAAMLHLKREVVYWIAVDQSTGWTGEPISSKDAMTVINDKARLSYVRTLIERCESFNAATIDITDHKCALMLAPEQQAAYRSRVGKSNPTAPINLLGSRGQARIEKDMRFWSIAPAQPGTWAYRVKYLRTEMKPGGRPLTTPWNAEVYFSLHPDAAMTPSDLLDNPEGFFGFSYSTSPEGPAQ
jgi:type IV secretory pathway component VirB8